MAIVPSPIYRKCSTDSKDMTTAKQYVKVKPNKTKAFAVRCNFLMYVQHTGSHFSFWTVVSITDDKWSSSLMTKKTKNKQKPERNSNFLKTTVKQCHKYPFFKPS